MATAGTIDVKVGLDLREFKSKSREAKNGFKGISAEAKVMSNLVKTAMTGAVAKIAYETINLASDFQETNAKFNTAFRGIEEQAEKTANTLANNYKMSRLESQKLLSSTGDLLKGFGFTADGALGLSAKVQALSADLASYNNLQGGTSRASEILTKAMLGEREALTSLGIKISEADVKQRLLEKGQQNLAGQALLAAKAQATFELAVQQSGDAMGDMARTGDSYANQIKEFKANINDLAVEMGEVLLPVANAVVKAMNNFFNSMEARAIKNAEDDIETLSAEMVRLQGVIAGTNDTTILTGAKKQLETVMADLQEAQNRLEKLKLKAADDVEIDFNVSVPKVEQAGKEAGKTFWESFQKEAGRFDIYDMTKAYGGMGQAVKRDTGASEGYQYAEKKAFDMSGGYTNRSREMAMTDMSFTRGWKDTTDELKRGIEEANEEVESSIDVWKAVRDATKKANDELYNSFTPTLSEVGNSFKDLGLSLRDNVVGGFDEAMYDIGQSVLYFQGIVENFQMMMAAQKAGNTLGMLVPGLGAITGVVSLVTGLMRDDTTMRGGYDDMREDDKTRALEENTEAIRGLNENIFNLSEDVKLGVLRARTTARGVSAVTGVVR